MTVLAQNKRAGHKYQLHERIEAGLVLEGWEVKGIMNGKVQLVDTFVAIRNGEAWLSNCHIAPQANVDPRKVCEPRRPRKLLLKTKELRKLIGKVKQTGMTIVVLDLHRSNNKIKATIALGKGKKIHEKKRALKERDLRRKYGS